MHGVTDASGKTAGIPEFLHRNHLWIWETEDDTDLGIGDGNGKDVGWSGKKEVF